MSFAPDLECCNRERASLSSLSRVFPLLFPFYLLEMQSNDSILVLRAKKQYIKRPTKARVRG